MKSKINYLYATTATKSHLQRDIIRTNPIRKRRPEDLSLRQLHQYLLFSKLRSLLPPQTSEVAAEYEPALEEVPADSDEETSNASGLNESKKGLESEGKIEITFEESDNYDHEGQEICMAPFVPSIKIEQLEESLLISTVVDKDIALSSALFRVLEEERLDIVFENQYRTQTKVAHTLQARTEPGYNVEALEWKLRVWAGADVTPVREGLVN